MSKFKVSVMETVEYEYHVEAKDEAAACEEAERLCKEDASRGMNLVGVIARTAAVEVAP